VFWVISVYFNIRNTLPKSGTFLLGHLVFAVKRTASVPGRIRLLIISMITINDINIVCLGALSTRICGWYF